MQQVKAVMGEAHSTCVSIFTYFAASGGDMHYIELNQWTQFVSDIDVVDNSKKSYCKKADFDTMFIAVDAAAARCVKEGLWKEGVGSDRKKALSRIEFLYALLNMSINRYIASGELSDVSEAFKTFLDEHVIKNGDTSTPPCL